MTTSRLLAAAVAAFVLHAPAAAQQGGPADTARAIPLEPVTVTVLRTPLSITEVPYAVAVNGQTQIQRAQPGLALDEALRGIPGVQVENRHNYALGERISIRGFGARSQFGVRGVKVLVDGIPATMPDGQTSLNHVDLSFLRRAEVIRGPASSLYGNTAGGVILLETELPPAERLGQEFALTAGDNGLLRLSSTTGGQRGGLSYLLNLSKLDYDGPRNWSGGRNGYANAQMGYRGEKDALDFTFALVDYHGKNPGALSDSLVRVDRTQAFANNLRQRTSETGRHRQAGLRWRREAGAGELEVSGYGLTRRLGNPIPNTIVDLERVAGGARALYRHDPLPALAGLQWTVGAEAGRQDDDRRNFQNLQGEWGDLTLDQDESVLNLAAFAQLSASPAERLNLLAGLRYDWFEFEAADHFVTAGNPDDSGARRMDALSPSLGLSYEASELVTLYGNVATSFETPTTTELANRPSGAGGFNPELEPQRALSGEVGAKGRLRGWLAYQVAAYRAAIDNALVPFEVPEAAGRQFFRNAGSATHTGVEVGATVAPLPRTLLQLAYTYTHARFDEYTPEGDDYSGNEVPGIAPHLVQASLGYETPGGWHATLEGRYSSELPVNDANTAYSPDYFVTDLRLGLRDFRVGTLRFEPSLGFTNLFDVDYIASVTVNGFGGRFYEPGPGRMMYAGLRMRL